MVHLQPRIHMNVDAIERNRENSICIHTYKCKAMYYLFLAKVGGHFVTGVSNNGLPC